MGRIEGEWNDKIQGTCAPCGKKIFMSRRAARIIGKTLHPHRTPYRCPENENFWHLGRLTEAARHGIKGGKGRPGAPYVASGESRRGAYQALKPHQFTITDKIDGTPVMRCSTGNCRVIWWPYRHRPKGECEG